MKTTQHSTAQHSTAQHSTAQHSTHRYFYHLLYGLLIIVCFFAYCKAGSVPVIDSDPDDMVGTEVPEVPEVPEVDVTLSLDCSGEYSDCLEDGIATIKNTIKTNRLPVYTVRRMTPTDKPVTVTLMWAIENSEGSGTTTAYHRAPKIMPRHTKIVPSTAPTTGTGAPCPDTLTTGSLGTGPIMVRVNTQCVTIIEDDRGSCNVQGGIGHPGIGFPLSANFYSFKFIGGDNEESLRNTKSTITVTIPANSEAITFRLDPHRCPDSTTNSDYFVPSDNSSTVSIEIMSIKEGLSFDKDARSKKLKVKFGKFALASTFLPRRSSVSVRFPWAIDYSVGDRLDRIQKGITAGDAAYNKAFALSESQTGIASHTVSTAARKVAEATGEDAANNAHRAADKEAGTHGSED